MALSEKGLALINVIVILMVLLALAQTLFEKVLSSTRQISRDRSREQLSWAAQSGIETARSRLASTYSSSSAWRNHLTSTTAHVYPQEVFWAFSFEDITVELFIRDNPDGDHDFQSDNDLKVYVLSRARNPQGQEIVVEALCGMPGAGFGAGVNDDLRPAQHMGLTEQSSKDFTITD